MDIERYLSRIGYQGPREPSLALLTALQRGHLLHIPFENLDIQLGKRVSFQEEDAYEKIVVGGRGGWCLEMNSLFFWALRELGFKLHLIAAIVWNRSRLNHLAAVVELDRLYLSEVGFSEGYLEPLPLEEGEYRQQGFRGFRLHRVDDRWWHFTNHPRPNTVLDSYDFTLEPAKPDDVAPSNEWWQTSYESPLKLTTFLSKFTLDGIQFLEDATFKRYTAAGDFEQSIESQQDYQRTLKEHFDLHVEVDVESIWRAVRRRQLLARSIKG